MVDPLQIKTKPANGKRGPQLFFVKLCNSPGDDNLRIFAKPFAKCKLSTENHVYTYIYAYIYIYIHTYNVYNIIMIIMLIFIYYHLMQYLYGHSILSIPDFPMKNAGAAAWFGHCCHGHLAGTTISTGRVEQKTSGNQTWQLKIRYKWRCRGFNQY